MRTRSAVIAATAAATLAVVLLTTVIARVSAPASASDAPTLHDGIATTAEVIAATAASYPEVTFTVEPGSADPAGANDLRNHRSLSDHSDPQRFPGYNDCDAWRNLINDGWSATSAMSAHVSPQQADALLTAVSAHWQAQSLAVERIAFGSGSLAPARLTTDLGVATLALDVDPQRGTARLAGTTDCLAPT